MTGTHEDASAIPTAHFIDSTDSSSSPFTKRQRVVFINVPLRKRRVDDDVVIHVQMPWQVIQSMSDSKSLPRVILHTNDASPSSSVPSRVAACSDGHDNDGDRLVDMVDPACAAGSHVDDEATDNDDASTITWLWGHDNESWVNAEWDFVQELNWTHAGQSRRVHWDEPSHWTSAQRALSKPCRYFPHGSNCSQWVWEISFLGWGNRTYEVLPDLNQTLVSVNSSTAVFVTRSHHLEVEQVYQLRGDALLLATTVTNLNAVQPTQVLLRTPLGSLQLGNIDRASGNVSLERSGLWTLDGKRGGSISRGVSRLGMNTTVGSGWPNDMSGFSGVGVVGDAEHWVAGFQVLDNTTDNGLFGWGFTITAADPHVPSIEPQVVVVLEPLSSRTVVQQVQFAPPAPSLENPYVALPLDQSRSVHISSSFFSVCM